MLIIRKEQEKEFARIALRRFEESMVSHVKENWPEEYNKLGEEAVRESILKGVTNAGKYGIETEHDIARYVSVMYALGHDFDTDDTRFPWAAEILMDSELNGREKMDKLCIRAEQKPSTLSKQESTGG